MKQIDLVPSVGTIYPIRAFLLALGYLGLLVAYPQHERHKVSIHQMEKTPIPPRCWSCNHLLVQIFKKSR